MRVADAIVRGWRPAGLDGSGTVNDTARLTHPALAASARSDGTAPIPASASAPQPFDIDLELEVDVERARRSDDLADTIDYAAVHRRVVALVAETLFALLERLADEILAGVMRDERVLAARVTIAKAGILAAPRPR